MMEVEEQIRLKDVVIEFSQRTKILKTHFIRAVNEISLSISKGEILALVGESGCGKTTLGRATLKLIPISNGQIIFKGIDVTNSKESELNWFRNQAQMIFQDPYSSIDPFMSVREILEEPLKIHRIDLDKEQLITSSLESVRLVPVADYLSKFPHMLSGGQRQRLAIARALILRPSYLFADEPVSMIDASSRAEILGLLLKIRNEQDFSCLYVTHDIATVSHFADRVAVMYQGKLVEIGTPSEVIESPLHPYTKALIESVPEPDPSNKSKYRGGIQGESPNPNNVPSGCSFHPRCPQAIRGQCDVFSPELISQGQNRLVSCHLYSGT